MWGGSGLWAPSTSPESKQAMLGRSAMSPNALRESTGEMEPLHECHAMRHDGTFQKTKL